MRLSFPYFIGSATWRWKHTVAEIACSKTDPAEQSQICERFKTYFPLFATMYACPYCRGHLNAYVIKNKETWSYPIEFTLLGWNSGGDFDAVTIQDKLATIADGKTLRMFLWKLHNAVNSSIARQEECA